MLIGETSQVVPVEVKKIFVVIRCVEMLWEGNVLFGVKLRCDYLFNK